MQPSTRLLAAGILSLILMGAAQAVFGPSLPIWERSMGLSPATAGWLVSAYWTGSFAGVAVMFVAPGVVSARSGLVVMAAGLLVLGLAPGFAVSLAGAVLFGLGYGALASVFNPAVLRAFGPRGPSMLNLLNATFSIGSIAAPLGFVAAGSDPALTFPVLAALTLGLAALAGGITAAGPKTTAVPDGAVRRFSPQADILTFIFCAIGTEATLITLGPSALVRAGLAEADAARLLSAFFVAFLLARIAMIFLAARLRSFTTYLIAALLVAGASLAAVLVSPALAFPVMGISAGLFFPAGFVTGTRHMGDDPRVSPMILAVGLAGAIILPLLVAQLMAPMEAALGNRAFFWLLAGFMSVVSLGAALRLRALNG